MPIKMFKHATFYIDVCYIRYMKKKGDVKQYCIEVGEECAKIICYNNLCGKRMLFMRWIITLCALEG